MLRRFGVHDKKAAEAWLKLFEQEQAAASPTARSNSSERADLLAQIALELAKTNPEQAQELGLLSLSANKIPEAYGRLLIALSSQRNLGDVLFRAAIAAMRRNGYAYSPVLIHMSNYLFFSDGRMLPGVNAGDVQLFINYLASAANAQVSLLPEARLAGGQGVGEFGAKLFSFFASRAMPIIKLNAPDRLQLVQSVLEELASWLTQQQLQDTALLVSSLQQQNAITSGFEADLDTKLRRAEQEKDPVVRDNLLRAIAVNLMRSDAEAALSVAGKIDDQGMRAQTQDDVYLATVAGKLRSSDYEETRRAALRLNSPLLQAEALAELADRALSASKDIERATDLLSEAYTIASKNENAPDKFAVILGLAVKFAKFDPVRGFELLSSAIKVANQIPANPTVQKNLSRKPGPRVISYTVVGGRELSTAEHATLDSLTFEEVGVFAKRDYNQTTYLGGEIQNKILRARFLIAVASSILRASNLDSVVKDTQQEVPTF